MIVSLIAKYREQKGLSQEDMAKEIGIASVSLCRAERRFETSNMKTLIKIAEYLGVKFSDLYVEK